MDSKGDPPGGLCAACGQPVPPQARFCGECGAAVARRCPQCQVAIGPTLRFCTSCGHRLEPSGPGSAREFQSASPSRPPTTVGRDRVAREGERRTVTVLFADAVGSTPIAERIGEEEMYGLIQGCVKRMVEAVHHYEGHIAHFTGDGVMAVFGAPVAHEEAERRAAAAALRMQRALEEYASEVHQRHAVECHFRVGLNTGPVVIGSVGDDLVDFTAIGDTVNLAARMQEMAEPGSAYLTESTYRAIADHIECEQLGELAVKGKSNPVRAWRALRERAQRSRFEVAAERGLAPFVGRDEELAALERHLRRVRQGRGQVVLLSGDPGIGKSRLLLEFRRSLSVTETRWVQGHCTAYGRSVPYLPVIDLLKRGFGVEDGDDEGRIIGRVEEHTSKWSRPARDTVPYLRYLLSVDPGDIGVERMDPRERRAGILDGLRAVVQEESVRVPLVVVVEDLHWVDQSSEAALGALVDAVPSMPVLVLITHRPGATHSLERSYTARLQLEHLAERDSAALVRGVLGTASMPDDVSSLVTSKAEGNPFYTEEVLRSLVESGVLVRQNGSYALTRSLDELRIPDTVQEVILSRIDRLDRAPRAALQLASVIGREFTVRLLGRITDLGGRLEGTLADLKGLELIYERSYFPELAYMFKHALTHDVAYSTLLSERRKALHRVVGAAVEELYADRLPEHYETLAYHYYAGDAWEKALHYLGKAGEKAAAAYANQAALGFYGRALEVCERLGDPTLATSAELAHQRARVSFGIGDFRAAIADFDRELAAAHQLGDRCLEGMTLAHRGAAELWSHEFETAEATLRAALAVADEGFEGVRALASLVLSVVCLALNRDAEASALFPVVQEREAQLDPFGRGIWGWLGGHVAIWDGRFDDALRMLERGRDAAGPVMANRLFHWWDEARALGGRGDYEAALARLDGVLATCERVGDVVVRVRALNTVGWIYGELQDLRRAMEWNERGLREARAVRTPGPEVEMNALLNLGENLLALGRLDRADEHFREAEGVVRHPEPMQRWVHWRYSQRFFHSYGELWLTQGEPAKALACAEECLRLAEQSGSRKYLANGRRLRGQALLAQGRPDLAEEELGAALEMAKRLGSPPPLWKSHVALGDVRKVQGRTDEARRAYADALAVIDAVASGLTDEGLRGTFLASAHVHVIRVAAGGPDPHAR